MMKKWAAVTIVLAIVICTGFAVSEGIDLAGLNDDELVALMGQVQAEIVARHIAGTATLSSGAYIAGRDIPAGSYTYTCLASGKDWGNVTVYSQRGEGDQLFWEIVSAPEDGEEPESFFITLDPDDQLESGVPFSLTIYAGVEFR